MFPHSKPKAWGWDGDEEPSTSSSSSGEEDSTVTWNPKRGFMKTRAMIEEEQRKAAEAAAANVAASSSTSAATGSTSRSSASGAESSAARSAALPVASRSQVLTSCLNTSFWLAVIGVGMRVYAGRSAADAFGTDPEVLAKLLAYPSGLAKVEDAVVLAAGVAVVSGARLALLQVWPDFRDATNRSNKQVLTNLKWPDVALVCLATGASEEILFRGGIIPASFPDWKGIAISAAIFGLLHNNGGRNLAFSAWAAAVGALYGGAFVYTQNVWVPVGMHAVSNFCSAAFWITGNRKGSSP